MIRHQVRLFIELAFKCDPVNIEIEWKGKGVSLRPSSMPPIQSCAHQPILQVDEIGFDKANPERVLVRIDPKYFRPTEVPPRTMLVPQPPFDHQVTDGRWSS